MPSSSSPSRQQLTNLLTNFQAGDFGEAEKLALAMTQEFPNDSFAWKILASAYKRMGRKSEAVSANETAVALSPMDAEAHFNL